MTPLSLLIVFKRSILRDELVYRLIRKGFNCLVTDDGLKAVQLIKTHPVSQVITQIDLAKSDGIELALAIRDLKRNIPIIAAGVENKNAIAELYRAGVNVCIKKEFSAKDIIEEVFKNKDRPNDLILCSRRTYDHV